MKYIPMDTMLIKREMGWGSGRKEEGLDWTCLPSIVSIQIMCKNSALNARYCDEFTNKTLCSNVNTATQTPSSSETRHASERLYSENSCSEAIELRVGFYSVTVGCIYINKPAIERERKNDNVKTRKTIGFIASPMTHVCLLCILSLSGNSTLSKCSSSSTCTHCLFTCMCCRMGCCYNIYEAIDLNEA